MVDRAVTRGTFDSAAIRPVLITPHPHARPILILVVVAAQRSGGRYRGGRWFESTAAHHNWARVPLPALARLRRLLVPTADHPTLGWWCGSCNVCARLTIVVRMSQEEKFSSLSEAGYRDVGFIHLPNGPLYRNGRTSDTIWVCQTNDPYPGDPVPLYAWGKTREKAAEQLLGLIHQLHPE